jgi:malonyl-CoA O-methyltransferase
LSAGLDRRAVRRSFERAAPTYDHAAALQREVCDRMLARLDLIRLAPRVVLDAGCGTGYALRPLARRFPHALVVALDIAEPMVRRANANRRWWQRLPGTRTRQFAVCADNDRLPLPEASCEMVWSNLAFQWSPDVAHTLREMSRVLAPGGLLMFSTFGPDTLKELRAAFATANSREHVSRFVDMHDVGDLLIANGLADPVMDMEYFTLTYARARDLMLELKALGARNANVARARGLTGRRVFARAEAHYERLRNSDGRLPATFEVIYGHAWKPAPRIGSGGRRVIDIRVDRHG